MVLVTHHDTSIKQNQTCQFPAIIYFLYMMMKISVLLHVQVFQFGYYISIWTGNVQAVMFTHLHYADGFKTHKGICTEIAKFLLYKINVQTLTLSSDTVPMPTPFSILNWATTTFSILHTTYSNEEHRDNTIGIYQNHNTTGYLN